MAPRKAKHLLREFALIRTLQRRFASRDAALIRGIGDDAAVVASAPRQWWHLTTDLLAEGIHFDLKTASAESVGYRATMANLSDLAAMGATPRYLLTAVAVPSSLTPQDVARLYNGLMNACRPYRVKLIGGDTSASRSGLVLTVILIGTSQPGLALFRSGARVGDLIYVTGTLGDSLAGLHLLDNSTPPTHGLEQRHRRFLINRHLRPNARVREGRWLNEARMATAAIDLSDGLSGDLRHLCEESSVGADIEAASIPLSPACRAYAQSRDMDPVQLALTGGEDYELLFTVSPRKRAALERAARQRGYDLACIGTIRPRRIGMRLVSADGAGAPLPVTSYEHFRS